MEYIIGKYGVNMRKKKYANFSLNNDYDRNAFNLLNDSDQKFSDSKTSFLYAPVFLLFLSFENEYPKYHEL